LHPDLFSQPVPTTIIKMLLIERFGVVLYYSDKVRAGKIAPHDLRRTFAKFATKAVLDWIRFSYRLGTDRFKQPSGILESNKISRMRRVIISD